MKKWLQGCAVLLFFCAFFLGAHMTMRSWGGIVYVSSTMYTNPRTPAAIRKVFDFSHLEGSALTSALQTRLLSDVKVVQSPQGVGIELGHFVTKNDKGEKVFACEYYDTVELTFLADGIVEDGERPVMVVQGGCRFSDNVNRIDPILIPVAKILQEQPGNMDLSFNDQNPVSLRFKNMGPSWPKYWSLYTVRLFNREDETKQLIVDEKQMRKLFARLIPVNF